MMNSRAQMHSQITFKQRIDFIKNNIDVKYLLHSLGFVSSHESSKELRGACPIHKGDNTTAFRFNKERNTWVCFTSKCHELNGQDIIGLVRSANNLSFMEAVNYLENLMGGSSISMSDYLDFSKRTWMQTLYRVN